MTARGPGIFRTLSAVLAALTMLVSTPAAAAFGICDDQGSACFVSCDTTACDAGAGGDAKGGKDCASCAFSHAGHSIATPTPDARSDDFGLLRSAFASSDDAVVPPAPRDGPEHRPKA